MMFLFKMFGIHVGYSVIRFYFHKKLITSGEMTKIVSVYFAIQVFQSFFVREKFLQWCFIFIPVAVFLTSHFIFMKWLENRFRTEFPGTLTNIILRMKMGKSFRTSVQEVAMQSPPRLRAILESIFDLVAFSQQQNDKKMTSASPFAREILCTFLFVDQSSHRAVEKLENFRMRLIILNEFRRRSGQIRGQIQMQAYVLTALYVASFAFIAFCFPIRELGHILLPSFALFLFGLICLFVIGRRVKWKI